MDKVKKILGSRTVWIAILQAVAGVVTVVVTQHPELAAIGWIAIAKSILDFAVRYTTTKSLK